VYHEGMVAVVYEALFQKLEDDYLPRADLVPSLWRLAKCGLLKAYAIREGSPEIWDPAFEFNAMRLPPAQVLSLEEAAMEGHLILTNDLDEVDRLLRLGARAAFFLPMFLNGSSNGTIQASLPVFRTEEDVLSLFQLPYKAAQAARR